MRKGIYLIGTDTDVGKTVVAAGILHVLNLKGVKSCYFKPASSGGIEENGEFLPYDAVFVKKIAKICEEYSDINPYSFKAAFSPHIAARIENNKFDVSVVLDRYERLKNKYGFVLVEGCGGIAVPLTDDGYMQYQLIKELELDCVIVSRTTIGTINHTLLTLDFVKSLGRNTAGIIFNDYSGRTFEQDNIKMIEEISDARVLGVVPKIDRVNVECGIEGNLKETFESFDFLEMLI